MSILKKLSIITAGAALIALGGEGSAYAAAIDFASPGNTGNNGSWSLGYQFTTNQDIFVTDLGYFDDEQNGFTENHEVGIYNSSGTLLVSGILPAGNSARLDGFFRYTSVAPTLLASGQTFYVAGTTGSEFYTSNPTGFTVDPAINFVADAFVFSTNLAFPSGSVGEIGWFGGNFELVQSPQPTPVPFEFSPGLGILALGACGAISQLKSKMQKRKALNVASTLKG